MDAGFCDRGQVTEVFRTSISSSVKWSQKPHVLCDGVFVCTPAQCTHLPGGRAFPRSHPLSPAACRPAIYLVCTLVGLLPQCFVILIVIVYRT
jgi:hypothetical protein